MEFLAGPGFPGEKLSFLQEMFELLCYKQVSASGISLFMFCEDYLGDEGIQLIMNNSWSYKCLERCDHSPVGLPEAVPVSDFYFILVAGTELTLIPASPIGFLKKCELS